MQITLTCVAFQDGPPPDKQVTTIGPEGGSIGRARDNDLVLTDPDHFASRHHAWIRIEDDTVYIEDTSNNGTLVNDTVELFPGQRHALADGDTLLIGECTLEVKITADDAPATKDTSNLSSSIDAAFDMSDEPVAGEPASEPETSAPASAGPADAETPRAHLSESADDYESDSQAIDVFLDELQIDPTKLERDIIEIMGVAGVVLRTLTSGVMEMLKARTSVKKTFGMDTTKIKGVQNNALKFSISPEESLTRMLNQEPGFLDPVESVQEAVHDAQAHQVAMVSGMNAAIRALLARFDPDSLEQQLDQGFTLSRKAKYWDLYREQFAQIAKESENDFNNLFAEEFRKTYEEQVRKLQSDQK